jgi:hypothetical protein
MLILLAALVDIEGGLAGSPTGKRSSCQGLIDYYAALSQPGITKPKADTLEPPTILRAPPERLTGTIMVGGHPYVVVAGCISCPPEHVAAFMGLGFTP